jgi:hypothetical protein
MVNRAGTRTLIAPVEVVAVFVVAVAVVFVLAVAVVALVCVGVAGAVVVVVAVAVVVAGVDAVEVDFAPPQPATASAPKRIASPLTFAG